MSVTVYCIISLLVGGILGITIGNFYPFRSKAKMETFNEYEKNIRKSRIESVREYVRNHLNGSWECISYSLLRGQCKIILKKEKNTIIIDLSKGISIGKGAVFSDVKDTSGEWTFSIMSQKQQIK